MRKLLILLGGLLAVLIGLAVAVVLLVDPDDYREEIAARASSTLGREVRLDGPISLRLFPWVALDIEDVAVGNPPDFDGAPAFARVGQAAVAVRLWPLLRGDLEIGTVSLSQAHLAIVTDASGRSNLDGLLAAEEAPAVDRAAPDLSRLSLGRLQLREVTVEMLDMASGARTLARLATLELEPFQAGQLVPFSLRGSVSDGEVTQIDDLTVEGLVRVAPDLARLALEDWRADLRLPAAAARIRAEGDLEARLDGAAPVVVVRRLSTRVDAADQDIRFDLQEPLRLEWNQALKGELAAARLSLNGQALDLTGAFVLGDPVDAELTVNGERLDLRPLLTAIDAPAENGTAGDQAAADFSALVGPRLSLDLNLDEVIVSDELRVSAVGAKARLRDGQLVLDPLQAGMFGGSFAGTVNIDFTATPPRTQISPSLTGIRAEEVARLLSETAPLRGLGEMDLNFAFSGLTATEILASLDGEGSFRLDEGALLGVDLRRLIEDKLTVSTLTNVNQAFGGETPFRSLEGSIRAESGVIFLPDLNLNAQEFGARGQGRLDFAAGEVAYRLDLRLGETLVERLPRQLARATDGVIPLAISGPLHRPLVRVDLATVAEGAIQRELQDRLLDRLRPADSPSDQSTETEETEDREPRRRERSSDLLLRTLRERERDPAREPEPPPNPP